MNKDTLELERYKYILAQKQNLNDATFKVATIYQGALALIVTGQFSLVAVFKSTRLEPSLARAGTMLLLGLLLVISVSTLALLASGVAAWLGYRREEREIEERVTYVRTTPPKGRDFFHWYETYLAAFVVIVLLSFAMFVCCYLLPRLHG